jgi:hypothetical protein
MTCHRKIVSYYFTAGLIVLSSLPSAGSSVTVRATGYEHSAALAVDLDTGVKLLASGP